jgi:hypothetical protein
MTENISDEKKVNKKTIPLQYIDQKRIVDINKLLEQGKNRSRKMKLKRKIIFYSSTILGLSLLGTLITFLK